MIFLRSGLILSSASPYVALEKDEKGIWWFTRNNERFVSLGVNHVNNGGQDDGVGGRESSQCKKMTGNPLCGDTLYFANLTNYAPYFNTTMDRYGSEDAWASNSVNRLASWNFNTIGGWSSVRAERFGAQKGLYYAHLLDMGATWLNVIKQKGLDYDVWSPNFTSQCDNIAEKEVSPRATDQWLLGYQLDNELDWSLIGLSHYLKITTGGYDKAVDFLKQKYATIDDLNKAYEIHATSFTDVTNHLNEIIGPGKVVFDRDSNEWLGHVASQYFSVAVTAIRKYDTNHLILGMRGQFGYPEAKGILKALIPWVDVFDWHGYQDLVPVSWLDAIHNITGKPIIVGEFSFMAFDSNIPNTRGVRSCWDVTQRNCTKGRPYVTQTQRAKAFKDYVTSLMTLPYAVGYHWWQWADDPKGGRWPDGENLNSGLVHLDDDEYQLLTQQMTLTNAQMHDVHAQNTKEE